jgi:hypothetical protein
MTHELEIGEYCTFTYWRDRSQWRAIVRQRIGLKMYSVELVEGPFDGATFDARLMRDGGLE